MKSNVGILAAIALFIAIATYGVAAAVSGSPTQRDVGGPVVVDPEQVSQSPTAEPTTTPSETTESSTESTPTSQTEGDCSSDVTQITSYVYVTSTIFVHHEH